MNTLNLSFQTFYAFMWSKKDVNLDISILKVDLIA